MNNKHILCVGMCVLDIIHNCKEYPTEDTDKRCLQGYWQRGGNASNNCTVLRQLGANCEFLGMLSKSPAFQFLLNDCNDRGIDIMNCPQTEQVPPFSSVILTQNTGTRTIIHANNNFPILLHDHFKQLDLTKYKWIHFEGRNVAETTGMLKTICAYNEHVEFEKIITSLELEKCQIELFNLAEFVNYVFLGKDLALHMGWSSLKAAVFGCKELLIKVNPKICIICTWGADGCGYYNPSLDQFMQFPAETVDKVVDSLGAGDTFCAATIYALAEMQLKLDDAINFANRCAAFKLKNRGYDDIGYFFLSYYHRF